MKGFGLDYDALAAIKPDLVMVSACLNGQTGPHKDYPGFGGQGSALGGLQLPHRLARPRAGRPARHDHRLARAALRRRPRSPPACCTAAAPAAASTSTSSRSRPRTAACRRGCSTTRSTVSSGSRDGNRHAARGPARRVPAAPTRRRRRPLGGDRVLDRRRVGRRSRPSSASTIRRSRRSRPHGARSTRSRRSSPRGRAPDAALDVAEQLQAAGIEAVPVQDFGDLHADPQLAHRDHFVPLTHPFLGPGLYERNGFRLRDAPRATTGPGRRSARTTTGCSATCSGSTRPRSGTLRASGAVE